MNQPDETLTTAEFPDQSPDKKIPLFVDLDDTLVATDTLRESAILLLKKSPWMVPLMVIWLFKGRSYFKHQISLRASLNVSLLPYRASIVDHIKKAKTGGRRVILATAANQRIAHAVAQHLGIFDGVIASDENRNLKSQNKLDSIREITGGTNFDYIGDSRADLPIWQAAGRALVVNPSTSLEKAILARCPIVGRF